MPDKKTVRVEKWFGKKKQLAAVRTVCSHITNLICGVTRVRKVIYLLNRVFSLQVCFKFAKNDAVEVSVTKIA